MPNKTKPDLILLTDNYPYEGYEPFVNTELKIISSCFNQVTIRSLSGSLETAADLPENATTQSLNLVMHGLDKFRWLKHLGSSLFWGELYFNLRLKKNHKILAFKEILYTLSEADLIFAKLKTLIQFDRKQIFYSYWTDSRTLACVLLKRKYKNIKIISRAHGWDVYFYRHPSHYLPFRKLFSQKLDAFIFISEDGLQYTRTMLNSFKNGRMICEYLGTEKIIDHPTPRSSNLFRIYSCSNLFPLKRIHLIIDALSIIDDFEIEWQHYGTGPLEKMIKQTALQKLGGKSNIHYKFNGHISNKTLIQELLNNPYHFLINVSETEGIPVTMMEAMSMGVPVIATNVGGVNEIVQDNYNGYLLDSASTPTQIAMVICGAKTLSVPDYLQLQNNALNTWREKYNAQINYTRFIKHVLKM